MGGWVSEWVGGWMGWLEGRWMEKEQAVGMGRWVGGWVDRGEQGDVPECP